MEQPDVDIPASLDVPAYLNRIGFDTEPTKDLETLTNLQRAHLSTVPFENLDIVERIPVRTDLEWSVDKVVNKRRGGWCFELNGAFAALLRALGFEVRLLGAAVLLDGPNDLIDHLTLEVTLEKPYLVDVGFGESFIVPLELNRTGPQDGISGVFEFIGSAQGTTLTRHDEAGTPVPSYRFKRVDKALADFVPVSDRLRSDPSLHWQHKPFATRLIDRGPDRITLLKDRLTMVLDGIRTETPIEPEKWGDALEEHFHMTRPGGPDDDVDMRSTQARDAPY